MQIGHNNHHAVKLENEIPTNNNQETKLPPHVLDTVIQWRHMLGILQEKKKKTDCSLARSSTCVYY